MERFMVTAVALRERQRLLLTIIGPEDDVVAAAASMPPPSRPRDTPELREQLRSLLDPRAPTSRASVRRAVSRLTLPPAQRGPGTCQAV